jgi:hypothetical protein
VSWPCSDLAADAVSIHLLQIRLLVRVLVRACRPTERLFFMKIRTQAWSERLPKTASGDMRLCASRSQMIQGRRPPKSSKKLDQVWALQHKGNMSAEGAQVGR